MKKAIKIIGGIGDGKKSIVDVKFEDGKVFTFAVGGRRLDESKKEYEERILEIAEWKRMVLEEGFEKAYEMEMLERYQQS